MEDLITSNVFGSLKYVPYSQGLYFLLKASINEKNELANLPSTIRRVQFDFWPRMTESDCRKCEPDVLIRLIDDSNKKWLILVESKLYSDKSSDVTVEEKTSDQLAWEWENLLRCANREESIPLLLYATKDSEYPIESVNQSISEFCKQWKKDQIWKKQMHVFWISWLEIPRLFAESNLEILIDLTSLLRKQGLTLFEGIKNPESQEPPAWEFETLPEWQWLPCKANACLWRFNQQTLIT